MFFNARCLNTPVTPCPQLPVAVSRSVIHLSPFGSAATREFIPARDGGVTGERGAGLNLTTIW